MYRLQWGSWRLDLTARTHLMGVLNVTPDSFSDGGRYLRPARALAHAEAMAEAGADLIDVGGESTRPGARPVPLDEELRRVIPVIEKVAARCRLPISIDTSKAEVARRALEAGAAMINDVTALRGDPAMAGVAAAAGVPVVLMHMRGTPATMQRRPRYRALMDELLRFFRGRIAAAVAAGIDRRRLLIDPGLGFGKTLAHNLEILRRLERLARLNLPILVGPSRKSFVGALTGQAAGRRVEGTAAAVTAAVLHGAHLVRVHDVAEMARVVRVADAIRRGEG
ncbi:MAG TPA: dihydropteroate synthase [Nitrospiria bacterium]|nr:dihydropteroate synthase [Nitrospiria bacterium]